MLGSANTQRSASLLGVWPACLTPATRSARVLSLSCYLRLLSSHCVLLVVHSYFSAFHDRHFARSGCIASSDFSLEKGPLPADVAPHPLEPTLRKLGLPTRLAASVVELMHDTVVCSAGDVLTPEQCRLLQLFDQRQAAFRIHIIAALTYTAGSTRGRLAVIREGAGAQSNNAAAASVTASRPRRRTEAARTEDASTEAEDEPDAYEVERQAGGRVEDEEDEEDEGDEVEEFVPEPMMGWGDVAVPTYT